MARDAIGYTAEQLEELLTKATLLHYKPVGEGDEALLLTDLTQATDPGRLAVGIVRALAEVIAKNNEKVKQDLLKLFRKVERGY